MRAALAGECRQCCAAEGGDDAPVGPFTSATLEVDGYWLKCAHANTHPRLLAASMK